MKPAAYSLKKLSAEYVCYTPSELRDKINEIIDFLRPDHIHKHFGTAIGDKETIDPCVICGEPYQSVSPHQGECDCKPYYSPYGQVVHSIHCGTQKKLISRTTKHPEDFMVYACKSCGGDHNGAECPFERMKKRLDRLQEWIDEMRTDIFKQERETK